MVEWMNQGWGLYGKIVPGGVGEFARKNQFRGVVYRDGLGTSWSFGEVPSKSQAPEPCN